MPRGSVRANETPLPSVIDGAELQRVAGQTVQAARVAHKTLRTDETGWALWLAEEVYRDLRAYVRQHEQTTAQTATGIYSHWQ